MAWTFNTATIPAVAANAAGTQSFCNQFAGIITGANSDWSFSPATRISSLDAAQAILTHVDGTRISLIAGASGLGGQDYLVAGQSYSGVTFNAFSHQYSFFSYVPASQAGAIPSPHTGSLLTKQMFYTSMGTTSYIASTESRVYVWSRNSDLIIAVQQNTGSSSINCLGLFGRVCGEILNVSDNGVDNDVLQWTLAGLTTPTNASIGQGQCYDAAGARIKTVSPIAASYLVDSSRQDLAGASIRTIGCVLSSAGKNIDTGTGLKAELDTDVMQIGPTATSLRATLNGGSLIHIGAGILLPWDSSWGAMP